MNEIGPQVLRFGVVGIVATATHFVVALMLISGGVAALWANGVAFFVAFHISFLGHRRFTFAERKLAAIVSMRRFALTALGGFALSETLLGALLAFTTLAASLALAITLATVAAVTFVVSRHWAFGVAKNE